MKTVLLATVVALVSFQAIGNTCSNKSGASLKESTRTYTSLLPSGQPVAAKAQSSPVKARATQ